MLQLRRIGSLIGLYEWNVNMLLWNYFFMSQLGLP